MISGDIHTLLGGFVGGRCYPLDFPQSPALPEWPAIRYTITGGETNPDVCGTDVVEMDDADVQFDAVALTYGAMITLRDQIVNALMNRDPPWVRIGGFETKDQETKTYRAVLFYTRYPSSQ